MGVNERAIIVGGGGCVHASSVDLVDELATTHLRRLDRLTAACDDGIVPWAQVEPFIIHECAKVGRDPEIERAKTAICQCYGVSRGDAFRLLRQTSQDRNRKLRDVARDVVLRFGHLQHSSHAHPD